ncbi:MAG: hypothetical protein GXO47_09855 [Chlorobi bacterium]|nr:hypothetical protein [Chlorobiota bacterium]
MAVIKLLEYPYPYKGWFVLSNDPDHTTKDRWDSLHAFLWEELELPVSDSLFIESFNKNIPEQVNLKDSGESILKHYYDTLHTWGDFVASEVVFDRKRIVESAGLLRKYKIKPLVWIDHSSFSGNLIMNNGKGANPYLNDAAGFRYENRDYSLDIVNELGIRYIWDGNVTDSMKIKPYIAGANFRNIISEKVFVFTKKILSKFLKWSLNRDENTELNRFVLKEKEFEQGIRMYLFRRCGSWRYAHIDGVPEHINKKTLNKIVKNESVYVFYTHLGKREAARNNENVHIPDKTKDAFLLLKKYYDEKIIYISPLSQLFDYVVLKSKISIEGTIIRFKADGVRYNNLTLDDVRNHKFSFAYNGKLKTEQISVFVENKEIKDYRLIKEKPGVFTIEFYSNGSENN